MSNVLLYSPKKRSAISKISQEKINDFYNLPKDEHHFGNIKGKPAQQSREKERRVKVPAQETHATSYSAILDFLFDDSETTNIWIQHTHKKHKASSAKSDSTIINSNTPPNLWKDHNHLSTKKPLSATAPLIKNRSWCIKSRLGSQRTLTWCKRYWSVSYASDHNIFLCSMLIINEETLIHFGSDISKIVAMLIFGNVSYFC